MSADLLKTKFFELIDDCRKVEVIIVIILRITIEISTSIKVKPNVTELFFFNVSTQFIYS